MIFDLSTLTPKQRGIIEAALARCTFPWEVLKPQLLSEINRTVIPVRFEDLSRYAGTESDRGHGGTWNGGPFHVLKNARQRALGLAWYSGMVDIEVTLEDDPELAGEVFFSEGAHMVDFFYMTDAMREGIWNAFHPVTRSHGTWFEPSPYYEQVGEAFMGAFVHAFTDYRMTLTGFSHTSTPEIAAVVKAVLLETPLPEPLPPVPLPKIGLVEILAILAALAVIIYGFLNR